MYIVEPGLAHGFLPELQVFPTFSLLEPTILSLLITVEPGFDHGFLLELDFSQILSAWARFTHGFLPERNCAHSFSIIGAIFYMWLLYRGRSVQV
jgi:hypothetical protein